MVLKFAFCIGPRRWLQRIREVQTCQELGMDRSPFVLVVRPTPPEQRSTFSLQTVKETALGRRDEQHRRAKQRCFTRQGHRLREDAIMSCKFSVERPRIALVGVLIGHRCRDTVKRIIGEGHDFLAVVNPTSH